MLFRVRTIRRGNRPQLSHRSRVDALASVRVITSRRDMCRSVSAPAGAGGLGVDMQFTSLVEREAILGAVLRHIHAGKCQWLMTRYLPLASESKMARYCSVNFTVNCIRKFVVQLFDNATSQSPVVQAAAGIRIFNKAADPAQ